eukprot:gene18866-22566_t
MASTAKPNFGILLLAQTLSVIGDSFGQRCSRVNFKHSPRHMMIGLSLMSALQMFVIFGILQLALPTSISGAIYIDNVKVPCFEQTDVQGHIMNCTVLTCTEIPCKSQEITPKLKALTTKDEASEIANEKKDEHEIPIDKEDSDDEVTYDKKDEDHLYPKRTVDERSSLINDTIILPVDYPEKKDRKYWLSFAGRMALRTLAVFVPMTLLCFSNALWMETSLFYNNEFRVNAFGYNSIDQILLPFYLFPFMLLVDLIKPIKQLFLTEDDSKETFLEAIKATWKECSLINLFIYRLLINSRAIIYFYLAIEYDLTLVYLELTLIRVVLNWLGAVFLNLIVPRFINATAEEKKKTFYPVNIVLKCLGTIGVVASLIILNVK